MTEFLIRHFVPGGEDVRNPAVRMRYGLLTSIVGICCNVALFLLKFLIGAVSASVSIMADSINNLSDAGSSVVTLVGFKVSGKPADEGHPFGHARAEYIGGLLISFMILLIGVEFLKTSLDKILNPQPLSLALPAALALAVSILVKVWMGLFNRRVGKRINSAALLATAQDSFNDVVTTGAVLLAAVAATLTGWTLDGWMGLLVALFILYSGFGIARDTVGPLLGQSPPAELVDAIEKMVRSYEGVMGVHDLVVHSYGPNSWYASLHAEVSAGEDILRSHDVIDNIEREVAAELGVHLVIHLDPIVLDDPLLNELRAYVIGQALALDARLTLHDFRLVRGVTHSNLIFDVAVPPGFPLTDAALTHTLRESIKRFGERYYAVITVDHSYVPHISAPDEGEE